MASALRLSTSVALRHVVEDGLAVLAAKNLEETRKEYVLRGLANLLQGAALGSELTGRSKLLVSTNERSAVESFSLVERYLGTKYNQEVMRGVQAAFEQLARGAGITPEIRATASALLKELLAGMRREEHMGIPAEPEEINFANFG